MKKNFLLALVGSLMCVLFSAVVPAQDNGVMSAAGDRYVISAKAGGANFVEGTVNFIRKDGKSGYLLKGDQVEVGDRVTTGADGKVEMLLNPGSYARLGGNSNFEFETTSLDDLQLKLHGGSAIFEVFASEDFKVTVSTPKAKMFLIQSGIYRVDVLSDGSAKLSVIKGRAQLAGIDETIVKGGRQALVKEQSSDIAKFDTDKEDEFTAWSKLRSKELSRISQQVQQGSMRTSLMRSFLGRGWNLYSSFGLWAYDPFYRSFCFLPFGGGWHSPYGWGFGPNIWQYNLPPVVYQPPVNPTPASQVITPIATSPRHPDGIIRPPFYTPPPFAQIQNDSSSGAATTRGGSTKDGGGMMNNNPVVDVTNSAPPSYSPPVTTSAPSTTRSDAPAKGKDN